MDSRNRLQTVAGALAALALSAIAASTPLASASATSTLKTLYAFCKKAGCQDGERVMAALLRDPSGNLFGTASATGGVLDGTVFALFFDSATQTYKFKVIHTFCASGTCSDGSDPEAGLIMDVNGNLYGTTATGGAFNDGTIFELILTQPEKYKLKTLYNFCTQAGCTDGEIPEARLTYDGAQTGALYDGSSPLYGVAEHGGAGGAGVAYQLTLPTGAKKRKYQLIYTFCSQSGCTDGAFPSQLTIDANGNLYGTGAEGGSGGQGVVFELAPSGKAFAETVLYNFCSQTNCADGASPAGNLAMDSSGNLFGTTSFGGDNNFGTVFKLDTSLNETVLHSFCPQTDCSDGEEPLSGVIIDPNGDLLGTTIFGGKFGGSSCGGTGCGTVFRLHDTTLSVLHSFCKQGLPACPDGARPVSGLILDASGNLFGTTQWAGKHSTDGINGGVVFELMP